ncbi:hypothetical protein RhiJN_12189 [Ceratobasidium sp. AG-Ba]|nr:hypothetical protein RhiJN_12189 [Ceratobasidium sp. AG-Ba]
MRKGKRTAPALPPTALGLIVDHAAASASVFVPGSVGDTWGARVWLVLHRVRALNALRAVSRSWRDVVDSHPIWRVLCASLDPHGPCTPDTNNRPGNGPSHAPFNAETFGGSHARRASCVRSPARQHLFPAPSARHSLPRRASSRARTSAMSIRVRSTAARVLRPVFAGRAISLGIQAPSCLSLAPLAANERDPDLTRGLDLRAGAGAGCVWSCREERIKYELMRGHGANMASWMGTGFWDWDWEQGGDPGGWAPVWSEHGLNARDANRLLRNEDVAGSPNMSSMETGPYAKRSKKWRNASGCVGGPRPAKWKVSSVRPHACNAWKSAEEIREREAVRAKQLQIQEDLRRQDEFDEESDEDDDLLSLSDEFGLREMIFQDWARNRVLEGIWLSPHMDMNRYHSAANTNPEMRTLPSRVAPHHPLGAPRAPPTLPRSFPYTVLVSTEDRRSYAQVPTNFYLSTPPPPNRLVYHLSRAWEGALRSVLAPALSNIVSRVWLSAMLPTGICPSPIQDQRQRAYARLRDRCSLGQGERDPCRAVTRINADKLVEILRGPEPWVEGGGWEDVGTWHELVLEDDGTSDEDGQSDLASCTPSPEALQSPSTGGTPVMQEAELEPETTTTTILTNTDDHSHAPLRNPLPRPLHTIPLIPRCAHHIGQQTKQVIELLWKENTGGLWMCRCQYARVRWPFKAYRAFRPSSPNPSLSLSQQETWDIPMEVHIPEREPEVEGKGKGVADEGAGSAMMNLVAESENGSSVKRPYKFRAEILKKIIVFPFVPLFILFCLCVD